WPVCGEAIPLTSFPSHPPLQGRWLSTASPNAAGSLCCGNRVVQWRCMETDNGRTVSPWMATANVSSSGPLAADTTADVCIVGAGIAGLTTAYLLGREGRRVIVLDDGPIGGGMTARTTAHLSNALDDRFYELERLFGEEGSRAAAESHTAAIAQIEAIVGAEH